MIRLKQNSDFSWAGRI